MTISGESTTGTQWSARLAFASSVSRLTVDARAADGALVAVTIAPRPTGTAAASWSLDSHFWTRDDSTQAPLTATSGDVTVLTTGMAMSSHGTTRPCDSMAHFACSTVSIHFSGTDPGIFTYDPDFLTRIGPKLPNSFFLRVKVNSLTAGGAYLNDDYVPEAGTLVVTQDAQGTFYYTIEGPLPVHREAGVVAGAPDAPATMQFRLHNGY